MVALLLAAALGVGSSGAVEVIAGDGVDPSQARQAEAGANAVEDLVKLWVELPDAPPARLYLFANKEGMRQAARRIFGTTQEQVDQSLQILGTLPTANADAIHNAILFRLDEPGLRTPHPGYSIGKIAAHERTHLWQARVEREYRGFTDPAWLVEGVAEYLGFRSAIAAQLLDETRYRQSCDEALRYAGEAASTLSLEDLTTEPAFYAAAAKAPVFCILPRYFESLERRRPDGLAAFYRLRRGGMPWTSAFEKAFGVKPGLQNAEAPRNAVDCARTNAFLSGLDTGFQGQ